MKIKTDPQHNEKPDNAVTLRLMASCKTQAIADQMKEVFEKSGWQPRVINLKTEWMCVGRRDTVLTGSNLAEKSDQS